MNRIKELRKQKKITQKELAKHLQIADSTLSYWEMGKYEPDNESLKKLSKFFLVPIDYILCGDFLEWKIASDGILYADIGNPFSAGAAASVGEVGMVYSTNPVEEDTINLTADGMQWNESDNPPTPDATKATDTSNTPNNLRNSQAAFNRSEFEGLTQDEIDKLAEYAEFLKAQRMKRKTGN
ncbi:MAG: helix-turn-helix domain-containing protein [Oscillospiraceae bacterium]|nr:helix-turn-helix domain-containing protein [Oscillospiraceae bacterium]